MTTRPTILDGEDHATDAHRAALLSLAGRIRDAVRPHVPGAHVQVDVSCDARGVHAPSTVASISVRVGEWGTGARVALDGHHATRAALAAVTAERDVALEECSTLRRGLDHADGVIDHTRASLGAADDEGASVAAQRVTRELAVLRAQQAPLLACVDALRAAARDAGWRDADATGETLVAWVRRGVREACARIARAHVGQQGMRAPAPRWMDVGERIAAAIEERGE
jgi:hypothetical protein